VVQKTDLLERRKACLSATNRRKVIKAKTGPVFLYHPVLYLSNKNKKYTQCRG